MVPSELKGCQALQVLALDKNRLTTLPRQLGDLVNLEELSLAGNRLTHLPACKVYSLLKSLFTLIPYFLFRNNVILST